jgi:hypothetical protein
LPLARHRHTGRFGGLVIGDQRIAIDQDPVGALAKLHNTYSENLSVDLPELLPLPEPESTPARRRGLYFCPFHPGQHASLQIYTAKGRRYVHCLSALSDCPLARHGRNNAFNVYCIGEGIDAKVALRRLNKRG